MPYVLEDEKLHLFVQKVYKFDFKKRHTHT